MSPSRWPTIGSERPGPLDVDGLLQRAADAELRGYGGAFFPVARKWQAAIDSGGRGIVVANGAESEPASAKDAALLQLRPHLVLDGLKATARATGSTEAVLWLHKGAQHSRVSIERAMVERRAGGVTDVPIRIAEGPARYLSGESSAIVRALSGGPALPHTLTVPAAVSGVDGRPTLVHNVETLARVGLLASGLAPARSRLLTVTTTSGQHGRRCRPAREPLVVRRTRSAVATLQRCCSVGTAEPGTGGRTSPCSQLARWRR